MADIINPDKTVMTHNADVYWHYAGDPVQRAQLLGTFTIGAPQKVLLPIPTDADIVLRAVPRGGRGQTFMGGPGDATPHTVSALGVGTGGGTSNFYQQLRVNHGYSSGYAPTPRPILNLLNAFQVKDDAIFGESDLSTFGVPTGLLNLRTDCNASGQIAVTTATVSGTDIVLATTLELQPGQGIFVKGAGVSGSDLVTKCLAVSADGKTITLAAGPFMPGPFTIVQADDTVAVQTWINGGSTSGAGAGGDLVMPPGYYRLTSPITLPTTSEGFSVIIHGSGWDLSVFAFQHTGDGFVSTSDLKIDSMVFTDLTIGTGTIGDAAGTINPANQGIGVRMTAPSYTGIYNNFVMQRCRVLGWGRWGLWSDNLEVSWISQCIFRENKSGHVAFVGPDTISPNKQPNANTITDTTFDQAISAGPSDVKRDFTGSMTAGSRLLNGSGFTAADRGKFVIVLGAATGSPGGDLYTFIDTFNSSTSVTLAHQAQQNSSGTVHLFPVNVASILLNRANDTVVDGSTIQGNFADAGSGATNVLSDVNAIKMYNSANCRFIGIHEEDNAGPGGMAIRMENCYSITIENWGGTSAGPPNFDNAHGGDFDLINSHCVRVSQCFFNDRPQFRLDGNTSEVEIDNSLIVGYINLWQQDASYDRLRIGSGVRVYQAADPRTNQVAGNEYSYDGFFGRNLIVNGRFLDGSITAPDGWTTAAPSWWSITRNSQTRGGTFLNVDATAIAASPTPTTILHQSVLIPDTTGPGLFTCAFDWNLDLQNGVETTGYYIEVRLHPSSGIDEVSQFSTRRFTVVQDTWQVGHIRCYLGTGTGRTIDVQVNVTPGPNNVVMHFANFRLAAGKHMYGAWEEGIHDFGGRMRAPLEFAPIATTGTGSTSPPPVGATYMSMVNDSGTLKLGYNGVWTTVGTTGTSTGVAAGTPNTFAVYDSPGGANIHSGPMQVTFGYVNIMNTGLWMDRTMPIFSVYPSGQAAFFAMIDTDDVVYLGPFHDSAGGSAGAMTCVRSGGGVGHKGQLWLDGTNGKLTFNDVNTNTYNTAFLLRTASNAHNAITITTQAAAYTGLFIQCLATGLDLPQFVVAADGDLTYIKKRQYTWPASTPLIASGGPPMVLGYTAQATTNAPVTLSWMPMAGGTGTVGPGTANRIAKFNATGTNVVDAPAEDATTEFHIMAVGLRVDNNRVINTLYASPVNYCELAVCGTDNIIRFGPALNNTGSTSGAVVLIRSGTGNANQGRLWIDGTAGKLTFNDDYLNNAAGSSSAFYCRILGASVHGLILQAPPSYTGNFLQCLSQTPQDRFIVDFNGDLKVIKSRDYTWPTTTPVVTGGLPMVLGYASQTTANAPVTLSWIQMGGGTGGGANLFLSNLAESTAGNHSTSQVAINTWLMPGFNADGTAANAINLGSGTMKFNAAYFYSGVFVYPAGSTETGSPGPRAFGFIPSATAFSTSEATRFLVYGDRNCFQSGDHVRTQIASYVGIELTGNRRVDTPPSYTRLLNATSEDTAVTISSPNDSIGLYVNLISGNTRDIIRGTVGGGINFRVTNLGDLHIHSVPYTWPPSNVAGVLSNNGTGGLSWGAGSSGVTWNSGTAAPTTNTLTKWTPGTSPFTIQNSSIQDSGIQVTCNNPFKVSISAVDKFSVNNQGNIFGAGGTRFGAKELQPGGGTTTAILTSWRTIIMDTVNGAQTLQLPSATANPGMIVDIIHMRAVQSILTPITTGYDQVINVQTTGSDVFNGWGGGQPQATNFKLSYPGFNGIPNPDNQHKIIRLIADELYAIWWLMPYYL